MYIVHIIFVLNFSGVKIIDFTGCTYYFLGCITRIIPLFVKKKKKKEKSENTPSRYNIIIIELGD